MPTTRKQGQATSETPAAPAKAEAVQVKKPVKASAPAPAKVAAKPAKEEKPKKAKLVRDSFTIPKTEHAVIETLKLRAAKAGSPAKKSELLRAGLKLLAGMDDAALTVALTAVPSIKTGRPAKA